MRSIHFFGALLFSLPMMAEMAAAQSLSRQFLAQFSQRVENRQNDITASISTQESPMADASPVAQGPASVAEAMAGSDKVKPQLPTNILPPPSRKVSFDASFWPDSPEWVSLGEEDVAVEEEKMGLRLKLGGKEPPHLSYAVPN